MRPDSPEKIGSRMIFRVCVGDFDSAFGSPKRIIKGQWC